MTTGEDAPHRELSLEVLRTARVMVLGGESGSSPRSTWVVLHGYRQLAGRFLRRFRPVAGPQRRVVAPEALSRFYLARGDRRHGQEDRVGASWMTREHREAEIRDYVRYLDLVARSLGGPGSEEAGHRTLLGFSQGAHTAARWLALGDTVPDRLVLWGAGLPRDFPGEAADRLRDAEVVLVRGEADGLRDPEEEAREEALLAEWRIRPAILHHAGGHEIDVEMLERLASDEGNAGSGG